MVKLDIYCGLLGAGKTTVIRQMLATAYQGHKVAIIENEVGKMNLDAEEFQQAAVAVREITSGCVCCTLKGNFTDAIDILVKQEAPEYIIVEPSGVAVLSDVISACTECRGVCLNRMIMIVKTNKFHSLWKVIGPFFPDQIRTARTAYLNFTETMDKEEIERVKEILWKENPELEIVEGPVDKLDETVFPDRETQTAVEKRVKLIRRPGAGGPRVAIDSKWEKSTDQFCYQFQSDLKERNLEALFRLFQGKESGSIWRAKAYLKMEDGTIQKIDYVFGDSFRTEVEHFSADKLNYLILIGENLDADALEEKLRNIEMQNK
ncbi:MAG: GTP-binding protein [Lachnospiraceae bacterium]|nr:GTP-binding protein [Lachnospiraceae bacterium]